MPISRKNARTIKHMNTPDRKVINKQQFNE